MCRVDLAQSQNGRDLVLTTTYRTKQVWPVFHQSQIAHTSDIPSGYLETCAAIGLVLFAHQMARINPRTMAYTDAMELALYNAVQVGVSLDGRKFFYDNPLAVSDKYLERKEWFDVACCPANVRCCHWF